MTKTAHFLYIIGPKTEYQPCNIGVEKSFPSDRLDKVQDRSWVPELTVLQAKRYPNAQLMKEVLEDLYKPKSLGDDWFDVHAISLVIVLEKAEYCMKHLKLNTVHDILLYICEHPNMLKEKDDLPWAG